MDRGDVDDAAPAALGDHLLGGDLRAEEGALQVHVHHELVLLLGGVEHRGARLDAGVVDHDVEASEGVDRRIDEHLQVLDLAHVRFDADGLVPQGDDLLLEFVGGVGIGDVVDDHVGPRLGQGQDDGLADPAVAAGDDGGLSLKSLRNGLKPLCESL